MMVRAASTPQEMEAAAASRPSWRVRRVAADLDCDARSVRRLIERGELEAHRIGKRGVRVYLDSLQAYKGRGKLGLGMRPAQAAAPQPRASLGHREAMAYLRRMGIKL